MKKILTVAILILISMLAFAQQKNLVGTVLNNAQKAIPFANIALVNNADAKPIKGTVSDSAGNFTIEIKNVGTYKVNVTSIGYMAFSSATITVDSATTNITLPNIILKNDAKTNAKVVVKSKKYKLIKRC
jgi:iron complex outermembrane recepter protein